MTIENTPPGTETFADKVTSTVDAMKQDESGKWEVPEGTSEEVSYAAMSEIRRRDTQSAFTKSQQENSALKSEVNQLAAGWENDAIQTLPQDEQDRLQELKINDPDAWREELNKVEQNQRTKFSEKRQGITDGARKETELERRNKLVAEYNKANPKFALTDDAIKNELPPRYLNDLESGAITFDEFMEKSTKFLTANKVIAPGEQAPKGPDLSKLPGAENPTQDQVSGNSSEQYKNETY